MYFVEQVFRKLCWLALLHSCLHLSRFCLFIWWPDWLFKHKWFKWFKFRCKCSGYYSLTPSLSMEFLDLNSYIQKHNMLLNWSLRYVLYRLHECIIVFFSSIWSMYILQAEKSWLFPPHISLSLLLFHTLSHTKKYLIHDTLYETVYIYLFIH